MPLDIPALDLNGAPAMWYDDSSAPATNDIADWTDLDTSASYTPPDAGSDSDTTDHDSVIYFPPTNGLRPSAPLDDRTNPDDNSDAPPLSGYLAPWHPHDDTRDVDPLDYGLVPPAGTAAAKPGGAPFVSPLANMASPTGAETDTNSTARRNANSPITPAAASPAEKSTPAKDQDDAAIIPGLPPPNVPPGHIPGIPDVDPNNPNGEPVRTIDGFEGWATRTALTGAHGFDKGMEGISRFVGLKGFADFLQKRTQEQEDALAGKPVRGDTGKLERLAPAHGVAKVSADVIGGAIANAPSFVLGGIPSLITMGLQAMGEASATAHDQAKASGATDEQATHAAGIAALKTLPETALYAVAGKATGTVLKNVLPLAATPLTRAATALVAGTATNLTAGVIGRVIAGKDALPTAADVVNALLFSAHGAREQHVLGNDLATARSIVDGTHPEMAVMDGIAQGKLGNPTPQQQEMAGKYSGALRDVAKEFIAQSGYKAPESATANQSPPPAEKSVSGRVIGEDNSESADRSSPIGKSVAPAAMAKSPGTAETSSLPAERSPGGSEAAPLARKGSPAAGDIAPPPAAKSPSRETPSPMAQTAPANTPPNAPAPRNAAPPSPKPTEPLPSSPDSAPVLRLDRPRSITLPQTPPPQPPSITSERHSLTHNPPPSKPELPLARQPFSTPPDNTLAPPASLTLPPSSTRTPSSEPAAPVRTPPSPLPGSSPAPISETLRPPVPFSSNAGGARPAPIGKPSPAWVASTPPAGTTPPMPGAPALPAPFRSPSPVHPSPSPTPSSSSPHPHEIALSNPTLSNYLPAPAAYAGRNSPTHPAADLHRGRYPGNDREGENHSVRSGRIGLDGIERGISIAGASSGRGRGPEENAGPYEPASAERRALEFIQRQQEEIPWLAQIAIVPEKIASGAPMGVRSGGCEWVYDKESIARDLNILHSEGLDELGWLKALVYEESVHVPQLLLAGPVYQTKYSALLDTLPIPLPGIIGLIYYGGRNSDGELPPHRRMIEYERMVVQYRETGTTTEELLGRDISAIRPYLAKPQPSAVETNIILVQALRKAGPANAVSAPPSVAISTTRQQILEQFARSRPLRPEEKAELAQLREQARRTSPRSPEIEGSSSRHLSTSGETQRVSDSPRWGEVTNTHRGQPVETRDGRRGTVIAAGKHKVAFKDSAGTPDIAPIGDVRLAHPAAKAWLRLPPRRRIHLLPAPPHPSIALHDPIRPSPHQAV